MKLIKDTTVTMCKLADKINDHGLSIMGVSTDSIILFAGKYTLVLNIDGTFKIHDTTNG